MTTLQERLRDGADICHARNIQLDYARVVTEAADRIDALEAEVESLQLRNQELAADKEMLLNHMTTLRNITKEPQVSLLTRLVLERTAKESK